MPYFDSYSRSVGDSPSVNRPHSNGGSLNPTNTYDDDRRTGDDEGYDSWLARQTSNGWPEWFVRWAFPREQYDGSDDMKGFKNAGTAFASIFGLGSGASLFSGGNLINKGSLLGSSASQQEGSPSSFANFLGSFGKSLGDVFTGISSQLGSSWLNYQNMEKLIDKQNAYNTPSAQMQRFADAGLNPNLIYGMGNNGNQPASGSIAPVDFDTSQREARLARMQIDTQTQMAKADVAQKMSAVKLNESSAAEIDSRKRAQDMNNRVFIYTWSSEQANRLAEYRRIINSIQNDNKRVGFEEELKDAQVALDKFRSQPEYMQKLGSAEDAMDFVEKLLNKLGERLQNYDSDNLYYNETTNRWEKYDVRRGDNMRGVGSNF